MVTTTTKDPFIGREGTDKRGIKWKVISNDDPDGARGVRNRIYTISFENGTMKTYTGQHLQGCELGTTKNWGMINSKISAGEYLGKEYTLEDGHSVKITAIVKSRYAYDRSIVELLWDTGEKCKLELYKVLGTNGTKQIVYDPKYFLPPREFRRDDKLDNTVNRNKKYKMYCKLPDNMEYYYAVTGTFRRHSHMVDRCYNPNSKDYKNYGARGVTICEEWHNIYNFAVWFEKNFVQDWEIDKDLMEYKYPDRKEYSPETCLMIPPDLNTALRCIPNDVNGEWPLGVIASRTAGLAFEARVDILKKRISSKCPNLLSAFMFVKVIKEYFACHLAAKILSDPDLAPISPDTVQKIMEAVDHFNMKDLRDKTASNYVSEKDIIKFLQEETDSKETDYFKLKNIYTKKYDGLFVERFKEIDELLHLEYDEE